MKTLSSAAQESLQDIKVVDADTHLTEPHDLWTKRALKGYEDRVPQVQMIDDVPMWTVDGVVLGMAGAAAVINREGRKSVGREFDDWTFDDLHPGSYEVAPRLELMDQMGVWAQIVYPNIVGFGGQKFDEIKDMKLRNLCATIYNDAMAEMQEESGGRICPMALLPWWDINGTVAEIERVHSMGLKGVNTNSDPHKLDMPDLSEPHWDPMWGACEDLGLPVNFHIGASLSSFMWHGDSPWPSLHKETKLALGSAMLYLSNARVVANLIYGGVLERFPRIKVVSAESGLGWIPFMMEALDYQVGECAPGTMDYLSMNPSEYFKRNLYACFWFENKDLLRDIDRIGYDRCLFESDFPHPTCLYPDPVTNVAETLLDAPEHVRRAVLSENAATCYNLVLPAN